MWLLKWIILVMPQEALEGLLATAPLLYHAITLAVVASDLCGQAVPCSNNQSTLLNF
jgi:hypothetical protein